MTVLCFLLPLPLHVPFRQRGSDLFGFLRNVSAPAVKSYIICRTDRDAGREARCTYRVRGISGLSQEKV